MVLAITRAAPRFGLDRFSAPTGPDRPRSVTNRHSARHGGPFTDRRMFARPCSIPAQMFPHVSVMAPPIVPALGQLGPHLTLEVRKAMPLVKPDSLVAPTHCGICSSEIAGGEFSCPRCGAIHCPYCRHPQAMQCEHLLFYSDNDVMFWVDRYPSAVRDLSFEVLNLSNFMPEGSDLYELSAPWRRVPAPRLNDDLAAELFDDTERLFEGYPNGLFKPPDARLFTEVLAGMLGPRVIAIRRDEPPGETGQPPIAYFTPYALIASIQIRNLIDRLHTGFQRFALGILNGDI